MSNKVLYIEDESDLVELANSFFEEEGIRLDCCPNIKDALSMIRSNSYEVIISDMQLPDGTGHELFDQIKKENLFSGRFILMTGNINPKLDSISKYDLVLFKPIDFHSLVQTVKRNLK